MSSSTKRAPSKAAAAASMPSAPVLNAVLLSAALAYGLWLLVVRGRVSWPPSELLANAYTVAGCLALVGPIVLSRRDSADGGLGDLAWMTAGLLVWVQDLSALAQGQVRGHSWATPIAMTPMGLTILAVLLAGWRLKGAGDRNWSWTNVTGWILGLLWVGMGLASLLPSRALSLAAR